MRRPVAPGSEISRERSARFVGRHHHLAPYAAVVLRGAYVEAGDRGRFRVSAGDVLLHGPFEAHQDAFGDGGADILNLPLAEAPAFACGRIADPDALTRLAERDRMAAADRLAASIVPVASAFDDWPDQLAAALRRGEVASLREWASTHRLSPSSVSRGFRLAYGVSPQRYRLEQRARIAADAAGRGADSLARVAAAAGFADQPHMTRAIRRCFACTPALLRGNCVQDGSSRPR